MPCGSKREISGEVMMDSGPYTYHASRGLLDQRGYGCVEQTKDVILSEYARGV